MAAFDISSLHVLIVDDQKFARDVIRQILKEVKIDNIAEAENGEDAISVLADPAQRVDLVLCDLKMPEMDGFAFLETVRRGERPNVDPFIPVIIVSALDDQESVDRVLGRGIDGYLVKPIKQADLIGQIERVMSGSGGT